MNYQKGKSGQDDYLIIQSLRFSLPDEICNDSMRNVLQEMERYELINHNSENKNEYCFKSSSVLRVFQNDGALLEYYVFGMMWASGQFADVQTGVKFCANNVKNEIDVIAVAETVPIFVSCKDTKDMNMVYLYEIYAIADRYGAVPVLIWSKDLLRMSNQNQVAALIDRAQKMGISLLGSETLFDEEKRERAFSMIAAARSYSVLDYPIEFT